MKTDDLIQQLSADLKPTRPLMSPLKMTMLFALIGFFLIVMCFFVMTARPDLKAQLQDPACLFEIALALLLSFSSLALSTYLSRPGQENISKKIQKITLIFLTFVVAYDGFRVAQMSQNQIQIGFNLSGLECFFAVLGFSIMLASAMIYWLRKGASTNPSLSGLVIGTATVALGNVAILFFCTADNGMHTLLWHFILPMTAALAVTIISSRFLLKW